MNQPYARVNQPYATLTLASALREMFGVQLYKNNARALLSRILSILNLDWLQHSRSVRGVYEWTLSHLENGCDVTVYFMLGRTKTWALLTAGKYTHGNKNAWLKCWHTCREALLCHVRFSK